ncbi:type III polyketide synthase [Streptomyces sp. NPDC048506]|uniref:type III polyketide synthase n=1 Tax=Streptomyces sp. NPDC048506 TaxID=3155028 RepID=UPI003445E4DD
MRQKTERCERGPGSPDPRVTAVETVMPPYRYPQEEITTALARETLKESRAGTLMLHKIQANIGVRTRHLSLPLEEFAALCESDYFTRANRVWLETALELGEQALTQALRAAGVQPDEVDAVVSTTVTGLAVPSLEARLVHRIGLRKDVKRIPLFGNACAGGAAGLARLHDYLRAYPDQVAVLLAVELGSLGYLRKDGSMSNIIAASIFGDGVAAVVAVGGNRDEGATGPHMVDAESFLLPDSEDIVAVEIGTHGFKAVLSPEIPTLTEEHLPKVVQELLGRHGLTADQVASWVVHGAGPKVFTAVERAFGLPPQMLEHTRRSLAERGNLASVSVLDVLQMTMQTPPPPGAPGLVIAMGPGFAIELVLVRW